MYCEAADVVAAQLALPDVQPSTDLDSELGDAVEDGFSTADSSRRPVEHRQHPIAGRFHPAAAKARHLARTDLVMGVEELSPAPITGLGGKSGGVDDVGEENGREDPVLVDVVTDLEPRAPAPWSPPA